MQVEFFLEVYPSNAGIGLSSNARPTLWTKTIETGQVPLDDSLVYVAEISMTVFVNPGRLKRLGRSTGCPSPTVSHAAVGSLEATNE